MRPFTYILSASFFIFGFQSNAQQAAVGCMDKNVRLQADEIKQHYTAQGFTVYRDAMLNMQSDEEFPVVMSMAKGQLYEIIFVGIPAEWKMKMEVFDGADKKVDEQFVMRSRQQPNYIIYTFTPQQSDNYMFTFLQKLKHERMCGSVTILKLKSDVKPAIIKPYAP